MMFNILDEASTEKIVGWGDNEQNINHSTRIFQGKGMEAQQ